MSRYRFILAEKATCSVRLMCRVLQVARSSFYARLDADPSTRATDDLALAVHIKAIHRRSRGANVLLPDSFHPQMS